MTSYQVEVKRLLSLLLYFIDTSKQNKTKLQNKTATPVPLENHNNVLEHSC
jgi:hypothetical protein